MRRLWRIQDRADGGAAMRTIWTDRSRIETYQRCNRLRFLEYHEGASGMGIAPIEEAMALVVGKSFHAGVAALLSGKSEDDAVATALAEFDRCSFKPDDTEAASMTNSIKGLGIEGDPSLLEQLKSSLNIALDKRGRSV